MTELKPCPFCGGNPFKRRIEPHKHQIATFMPDYPGAYIIECADCEIGMMSSESWETVEQKWNKRVNQNE